MKSEDIKISIITPAYNGEKYVVSCVESLLLQTLQEIEIIFVDDASTDATGAMLDMVAQQYPQKVKVIHLPENHGAGGARNIGIEQARGEYIGFVDIDDAVTKDMYEKLYLEAKAGNYDVVDCGYFDEAGDRAIIYTSDELKGKMNGTKREKLIVSGGYICTKIFKREFWLKQKLVFRENVILEDSEIVSKVFATMDSIGNVKEILYYYRNTADSSSKVVDTLKYYNSCFEAMKAIYQEISSLENYEEIRMGVEYELLQMYCYAIIKLLYSASKGEGLDYTRLLGELRSFRLEKITKGYDNPYVKEKIKGQDLEIMKLNDQGPVTLLKALKKK